MKMDVVLRILRCNYNRSSLIRRGVCDFHSNQTIQYNFQRKKDKKTGNGNPTDSKDGFFVAFHVVNCSEPVFDVDIKTTLKSRTRRMHSARIDRQESRGS